MRGGEDIEDIGDAALEDNGVDVEEDKILESLVEEDWHRYLDFYLIFSVSIAFI